MSQVADWSVLEIPGVEGVARRAASKVAAEYANVTMIEFDDLYQEALISLATTPDARECLADPSLGLGVLHTRVIQGLLDKFRTEAGRTNRTYSYEALRAGAE